jgi:hypothetical protein
VVFEATNSRIQGSMHFVETTKIGVNDNASNRNILFILNDIFDCYGVVTVTSHSKGQGIVVIVIVWFSLEIWKLVYDA